MASKKRRHVLCSFEDDDYCEDNEYDNRVSGFWRDTFSSKNYDDSADSFEIAEYNLDSFKDFCNDINDGILENNRINRMCDGDI